jgi:hypothetical protein
MDVTAVLRMIPLASVASPEIDPGERLPAHSNRVTAGARAVAISP